MDLMMTQQTKESLWVRCPFHPDTKASLIINLTGRFAGRWHCFGCGKSGNANELLGEDLLFVPTHEERPAFSEAYYQRVLAAGTLPKALADEWRVFVPALMAYGIVWDGEKHLAPMYSIDRKICGVQRRYPNGRKICERGSRLGLFLPFNGQPGKYNTLWQVPHSHPCLITEGLSDATVAYHLGYYAIGKPAAMVGADMAAEFCHRNGVSRIGVVPDNDTVGRTGAKAVVLYARQMGIDARLCPVPPDFKDLREWSAADPAGARYAIQSRLEEPRHEDF